MNKKLLSLAVAAAFAAPMAAQASEMSVYGVANVALTHIDPDAGVNLGVAYWDLTSGASRLGVKGSEDLGDDLKAIYKMEFQVRMTDANDNIRDNDAGTLSQRNTYVGLAGDWGTFLMGRHDTPLKISTGALDVFADTIADYNWGGALAAQPVDGLESGASMAGLGFIDARADNAVAYVSPSMNGLTLAGAFVPAGNSTVFGVDTTGADDLGEAVSLAAMYSNGPFYASLAYETYTTSAVQLAIVGSLDIVRAGLGYTANNFHAGFVYENQDASVANSDVEVWQLSGSYTFGNNVIKAAYGERTAGTTWDAVAAGTFRADADVVSVGLDHNFSKKTKAYAVYTDVDSETAGEDWNGVSVGLSTSF